MMGRRSVKNWFVLAVLVLVMAVTGEVCGIRAASAAAKPVKLRMMLPREPLANQISHVYGAGSPLAEPIVFNVMEPLVDYTKDGPVPKLAVKWEHSADLSKWRLYLRKGVKFHNGADFTARDVVEYAKWNIEEKQRSFVWQRVPLQEAMAVDEYTVDLIFQTPQPLFLIAQRLFLIPPAAISRDNRKMADSVVIGTGPYKFVEWKKAQHIKLAKFEGYWGPKPQIDDVEITFREEAGVRLAALIAGEVDWVYSLSPEEAIRAPKVVRIPSPETVWIRFDERIQQDPIFADKKLRLAVEYAIDRQALVNLFKGFATPSLGQFASPGEFGFNPNLKSRPYDLDKAKALVKEAGAVGKTVTFVCTTDRWPKDREVGEAVIYMIERTGLKVKPMLMPQAEADKYKRVMEGGRTFISDILLTTSDAFLEVESRFDPMFNKGGAHNAMNDIEPTALYKEVKSDVDYAKRGEKLGKAWAYVYEQAHYVPVFKLGYIWGIAKNLEWKVDIAGRPFFADMKFTD